ncbi:MAG: glycosyltransferase family 4 protein [Terracidiphilus sp.]
MRFAIISTMQDWPWGGSEELWSRSASQLRHDCHDVYISITHWPENDDRVRGFQERGITVESRPRFQPGRARRMWHKVSHALSSFDRLRQFAPDLVLISQGHNAGGFAWAAACRASGIPYAILVNCNSDHWWFADSDFADAVSSYTQARKVFCVSRHNLDLLRFQLGESLPNACIVWNSYNVDPDTFPAWPENQPYWHLANVARLEPAAKGQDILLRIFAQPKWRERPVWLNLYGSGPYESELRRIAESLSVDHVTFRGHISDIRSIWQENHLLVLPSRYEGLPLALVEAMWCARAATVTDVGGNAELCLDSQTGFVASAANTAAFEDALERAWQYRDDWREMGLKARASAEKRIPRDPITLFCEKLMSCVAAPSVADAVVGVS